MEMNVNLRLLIPKEQASKCEAVIDNKIKCTSRVICGEYEEIVFNISPGNHTLKICNTQTKSLSKIGQIKFDFFTASPKNHLNHILAFHHNINCFTQIINMTIHRDAELIIEFKRDGYYNFLNVYSSFLKPFIKKKSNIKINFDDFYIFDSFDKKTHFYIKSFFIFTIYSACILLVLILFSLNNFKNWNSNLGAQGFTGKSIFFVGLFPIMIYVVLSYFIYSIKLYKRYKYAKDSIGIDSLC